MAEPEKLTLYIKPTCTTVRQTLKLLKDRGIEFVTVDYYVEPLSAAKIAELLDKAGITPRELLRTRERAYKDLGLATSDHTDVELIELLASHPDLIQRPIAELGAEAVLCRPPERVFELLR